MISYNDSDILKIEFSTLAIKVSSIVKQFNSIENFAKKYDFYGTTNGVILLSVEMCSPPYRLEAFTEEVLVPNGFINQQDFVFIEEMLTEGVKGTVSDLINKPHPHCENINWLQSLITSKGNFIWYCNPQLSNFEKDANFRLFENLFYNEKEKIKLNPRIIKIDETYVYYTVSDTQMYYKIHRDALWYNELKYGKSRFSE